MSIVNKIKNIFNKTDFSNVRIEKLKPFEKKYEIKTDTVWFSPHNIEQSIKATEKLKIDHIFLQTKTLDFLKDKRLKKVKGISVQFKIDDLSPLYLFKNLTHLGIYEDNSVEFDFSFFPNLIFLNGIGPKKYRNFNKLIKLKYTYLRSYNKKDFSEFSNCKKLEILEIYSLNCQNFNGLNRLGNLNEIKLEMCPKLTTLNGIGILNTNLEKVHLINCKKLTDASALASVKSLSDLYLYKVTKLNSLDFLNSLNSIKELFIHPENVGVRKDDYYPLINKLKSINKIDKLKEWKYLKNYLDNKVKIELNQDFKISELQSILENLPIKKWSEKYSDGLEQYTPENCEKAEIIFFNLINKLKKNKSHGKNTKLKLIKESVLNLNNLNEELDHCFIETLEREELCEIYDNIADAVGFDIQEYEDGIISEWREW